MAIGELKIPDGEPLPPNAANMPTVIASLAMTRLSEFHLLQPGQYDVTPTIWTKHAHNHEVVVLDDGTGIYRMYPRSEDVGYQEVSRDDSKFKQGGRHNLINADSPVAIVGGGHPTKSGLQIFGLVMYLPPTLAQELSLG